MLDLSRTKLRDPRCLKKYILEREALTVVRGPLTVDYFSVYHI